jgi:hypothetical protein
MFERHIGMGPVGFDEQGNMFIKGPTETPQWAPGVKAKPWKDNDSGSIPLTEDKNYIVSSEAPGRNASVECRYVKLTITGWPEDLPCGVLEFTVFGRPTPL